MTLCFSKQSIFVNFVIFALFASFSNGEIKVEPYYEFHDLFDPYHYVFATDGRLLKEFTPVDDWVGQLPGVNGVLDCYGPGIIENSQCPRGGSLFHSPCGKHAILMCDGIGDSTHDDIFSVYDYEHGEPVSWGRTLGGVPEQFDITRAMVYHKKESKTDFLIWGIEFLPCKQAERTFVFEFNAAVVNFTTANETVPILDPFRQRGDLLVFVHFKPHHGINVEVYYLKDTAHFFTKHDRIVKHDFPFAHGSTLVPTFLTAAYNDMLTPSAIWGGVVSSSLKKDVNQPYTFFEGKIDLTPIKKHVHGDIVTNWVVVRSMESVDSELENAKLRDIVGPVEFKLGHHFEELDPYGY